MSRISIRSALSFSLSFLSRNFLEIAARIVLPALIGWVVLYISLSLYLSELVSCLDNPSDRIASVILGLATGGLLLTLLLHSSIVTSVTELAMGVPSIGWKYFHAARREWRVYAAKLRFLLVVAIWAIALQILRFVVVRLLSLSYFNGVLLAVMAIGVLWLVVRLWFLLAPVSVANARGHVLRRAWQLSSGHFWRIASIVVLILLVGLVIEIAGETILRIGGFLPPFPSSGSLAGFARMYQMILPHALLVIAVAYLVVVILLAGARADVYRQLSGRPSSE